MAGTLYLMRHGETTFNLQQRSQGWCDSPLTERGREQAMRAAARIRELGIAFDRLCCSTQERAVDTLELVSLGLYGEVRPYDRLKGLKESFYGIFEACPIGMLEATFERDRDGFVPYGGEPYADMQDRMQAALAGEMERAGGGSVLAVSHMRSSLAFLERVHGSDPVGNLLTNCALMRFDYEGDGRFRYRETIQTGGTDVHGNVPA